MSRVYSVDSVAVEALITVPEAPAVIQVHAVGKAVTSGWTHPELAPWMYIVPPKDGLLDLDFVAVAPTGIVLDRLTRISVTASFPVPSWVKGVRIHASTNSKTARFKAAALASASVASAFREGATGALAWCGPKAR